MNLTKKTQQFDVQVQTTPKLQVHYKAKNLLSEGLQLASTVSSLVYCVYNNSLTDSLPRYLEKINKIMNNANQFIF
jgi:hypothetical protein